MSEWQPVMRMDGTAAYWPGFVSDREYEFKRLYDDQVSRFVLAEQGPYFNIANLFWRED